MTVLTKYWNYSPTAKHLNPTKANNIKILHMFGIGGVNHDSEYGDSGSAARFFYCAKANKKDRNEGLDPDLFPLQNYTDANKMGGAGDTMLTGSGNPRDGRKHNHHPTVKPTDLMRYLCRLVTPPNGVILDPFTGSGSTGKAALLEGFNFIGIEQSEEYAAIAQARIEHVATNE
jgi:site-specific DNA-methyltransferase (adenine-specific)